MDFTQPINCVEWFFGYGGNHLGLKRVLPRLRCIAACEIEGYAVANMVAKMEAGFMDPFPIWSNVKTFPCEMFRGLVDLFIASYPCQGFSTAGKQEGVKDPRFLWPWCLRAVAIIQPRYCFFENVAGHVTLGLSTVISDLEEAGYRVEVGLFSAAECGAPQRRQRVFILGELADSKRSGRRSSRLSKGKTGPAGAAFNASKLGDARSKESRRLPSEQRREVSETWESSQRMANDPHQRCGERWAELEGRNGEPSPVLDRASAESKLADSKCPKVGTGQGNNRTGGAKLGPDTERYEREQTQPSGVGQADATQSGLEGRQGIGKDKGEKLKAAKRIGHVADAECAAGEFDRPDGGDGRLSQPDPFFWPEFVAGPGQPQHKWEPARVTLQSSILRFWNWLRAHNPEALRARIQEREEDQAFREAIRRLGISIDGRSGELDECNTDELRLLGNGVYPASAAKAFATLYRKLKA